MRGTFLLRKLYAAPFFERADRGIPVSRIHVPKLLFAVDRRHIVGVSGDKRRGLIDRRVQRTSCWARMFSGMHRERCELTSIFQSAPRQETGVARGRIRDT